MNRLEVASLELRYIRLYLKYNVVGVKERAEVEELAASMDKKRFVYNDTLAKYSYWNSVVQSQPEYRDANYMLSRYSFMLFNTKQSIQQLRASVHLDPLFDSGLIALHELENYPESLF